MGPFTSSGFCKAEQREGLGDKVQPLLFVLFRWVGKSTEHCQPKKPLLYSEPCAIYKGTDPSIFFL